MPEAEGIEIRRLDASEARAHLDGLAAVLADCVEGGASVGYLTPFSHEPARRVYEAYAAEVERGSRLLLAAFAGDDVVGTVQVVFAPPSEPAAPRRHREDARPPLGARRGIGQRLMQRAEPEAQAEGKTLLVLDTVTGDDAERLYERLGWTRVGVIPDYALYPDGRPCDTTVFWKAV